MKEIRRWFRAVGICSGMLLCAACFTPAQNVVVDATRDHVVNTFSPPHALGGAIDRLRTGTGSPGSEEGRRLTKEEVDRNTDMLLSEPVQ